MKNKQQHESEQKFNLGQHEASQEKEKDAKLGQMGERSKAAGRHSKPADADRKR